MPVSLRTKIEDSKTLTSQEKLVMILLGGFSMTSWQIAIILTGEPFCLGIDEVFDAMNGLNKKDLVEIRRFVVDPTGVKIDTLLTFAVDWVIKL